MHPELQAWVDLYFFASAFENQELQIYEKAGVTEVGLEVMVMLKGIHRKWQKDQIESR